MNSTFILMILSASALPILAVIALLLRRNLFKGIWKSIFLSIGILLLSFSIYSTFKEHGSELTLIDLFISLCTAGVTFFILSHFSHTHTHNSK